MLNSIKDDNYLRVLDLRKNKFTKEMLIDTSNYDFVKTF